MSFLSTVIFHNDRATYLPSILFLPGSWDQKYFSSRLLLSITSCRYSGTSCWAGGASQSSPCVTRFTLLSLLLYHHPRPPPRHLTSAWLTGADELTSARTVTSLRYAQVASRDKKRFAAPPHSCLPILSLLPLCNCIRLKITHSPLVNHTFWTTWDIYSYYFSQIFIYFPFCFLFKYLRLACWLVDPTYNQIN